MLNPFINLISSVISLINLALIIWVVLGLLIHFELVNRFSPIVTQVNGFLTRLLDPMLSRIRRVTSKFLPDLGGVDISPVILILILSFIKDAMYKWLFTI